MIGGRNIPERRLKKLPLPKKQFSDHDRGQVFGMAQAGASDELIAKSLKCSERTVQRHFKESLSRARAMGEINIFAKQYKIAMDDKHPKQALMLIWLGKQRCGQSDKVEQDSRVTANFAIINRLNGTQTVLATRLIEKKD